jgi:ferredoxin
MRPFRIGQIISAVLLNAYVLAYTQHRILYTGVLKRVLEPILNCYGGPLSVFACPLGSLQQIIGIHQIPWMVIGAFILVGIVVGRMACAWVCPFGLWQDLLEKIPIGPRAGRKRWISLAAIAGIGALLGIGLTFLLKAVWWRVFLFGWLPFTIVVLLVTLKGKMDIPARMWLGGFLAALGLGVLVWAGFGADFGVVVGVAAMVLLGLTGRWFAAIVSALTGLVVVLLGRQFSLGPLSGVGLAIVVALLVFLLVIVIDRVAKISLPAGFLKYGFLLIVAGIVAYQTGEPWFCKLCPQGTLEAGIPLVLWDPQGGLRSLVGWLYYVKIGSLLLVVASSVAIKRPFCRLICPIGAIYSVFNKFSLLHLKVDHQCTTCRLCAAVCPTNIEVHQGPNQLECIRCLECKYACKPKSVGVKF